MVPSSADASALATLFRATPASSVVPTHRPLVRADDHEAVAEALSRLAAARVLACPVYSRHARRYTAFLDAMDVAAAVMGVVARSRKDADGGIGGGSSSGGNGNGDGLSAVLARPAGAVANASRSNDFVCLDAAAPLAVAVATMAGRGAHRVALVEAGGGAMMGLLTQSAVVAWLVRRGVFRVPPLEAAVVSAVVRGGRGRQTLTAGDAAARPVVCLTVREGVSLRLVLARLLLGDTATVALVSADSGGLAGKLSPADVRALLGGVLADTVTADPSAVDAALGEMLDMDAVAWLGGQTLTTTACASAPAGGGGWRDTAPDAASTVTPPPLPEGVTAAGNALAVAASSSLRAVVEALVTTGQHHAFVVADGGEVSGVVSLTDVLATVAAAAQLE
ncbi:hypothetical protein MMPV_006458 [Pyropia vietnamensis]